MGLSSWLKSILTKEKQIDMTDSLDGFSNQSLSVYRRETPQKILETRIKPVRIPNLIDVGERLGIITQDIQTIKQEMVTKLWIADAYDDSSIVNKLDQINEHLSRLEKELSNFTKPLSKKLSDSEYLEIERISTPEGVLNFLKKERAFRYKDIKNGCNVSDPTLSKYLKKLIKSGKITRFKAGKAVFYKLSP